MDFSQLPDEITNDIFNYIKNRLDENSLAKVKFLPQSKSIIVNHEDMYLYGQLKALSYGHMRDILFDKYADKYSKEERDEFIKNGIKFDII